MVETGEGRWASSFLMDDEERSGTYAQPGEGLVLAPGNDCRTQQHPHLPCEQRQDVSGFVNHRDMLYHEEDGSFLQTTEPNAYIGLDS